MGKKKANKISPNPLNKIKNSKTIQPSQSLNLINSKGLGNNNIRGRHVLKNPLIVNSMIEKAGLRSTDVVLEVSSGTNSMTHKLADRVSKVIAYESDNRLASHVQRLNRVTVITGDVLKDDLPFFDVCMGAVPYGSSSALVFKLLLHRPIFRCAIIMTQRELAVRLVARPGDKNYCRLSANVQLLARVDHLMKIGGNNFRPLSKVESSVIRLEPRNPQPDINFNEWDGLTRIIFTRPNKTLSAAFHNKNVLSLMATNQRLAYSLAGETVSEDISAVVDRVLSVDGFAGRRGRGMDFDDIVSLMYLFNKEKIHFA